MAEQEVRPQQLSIAEIARLWSAETGDSAEDIERELAEWAYAASADGAQVGLETGSDKSAPATLKIEPDPLRELCRDDLDAFCRDRDRLLPHFWPEAAQASEPAAPETSIPGIAEPARAPRDMSRLVVRAMDRMGASALAVAASRRVPQNSDPAAPAEEMAAVEEVAAAPANLAAEKKSATAMGHEKRSRAAARQSEQDNAPPGGAEVQRAAGIKDLVGPRRQPRPARAAKGSRASKKGPAPGKGRDFGHKFKLGPTHDIASKAQDVPVQVMAPAPAVAAARPDRPAHSVAPTTASMIVAAGLLGGALIAVAGGAAWLEFNGPGVKPFLLGEQAGQLELAEMERRAADSVARAAGAAEESERLTGQLSDARRQIDTLRARIEDISSLGQRLTEAEKSNTELRRTIGEMTTALNAARSGGSAADQAMGEALNKANAATQAAREEANRLTEALATAEGEIEAGMLARLRLEQDRDAGVKALAAANDEIENLAQSGTAAQAVVQRLEKDLKTSQQQIQVQETGQLELKAQIATLNQELREALARAEQLTVAETESRRLGAALDTANLDVARLQSAVETGRQETAELASRLAAERQNTAQLRADANAAAAKSQALAQDLGLALKANTDLRAEADGLNAQAAQLSEFLATAREEAKVLAADRASATAKAEALERDLASVTDEVATLRGSLEGTNGASAQLAARLAAAERRVGMLSEDRREALARADVLTQELAESRKAAETLRADATAKQATADHLAKDLEAAKRTAAEQGAERATAQDRVKTLVASMAAAQAEVRDLRTKANQAGEKEASLLEAVEGWKAEAESLAANLAALKGGATPTAASDIRPQAGPSKEAMIGAAAASSSGEQKLSVAPVAPQQAAISQAAPQTARRDGSAKLMLARGGEYLDRGDIASARLFFEQAAELGDTAALTAVGRTYDPRVLSGLGVLGAFANPAVATLWYERAVSAGDDEASRHLEALRAWQNR